MGVTERWISYFIGHSLAAFGFSIVWLFATHRLYEPNTAWKCLEMATAGLLGILGLGWAAWNWAKLYIKEIAGERN